nr:restriction endonuclease subunit S [Psittacicella melopsittaci]
MYPVYSSQTVNNGVVGYYKEYLFENAITWTTDGANAGTVSYREGKFFSTNVNGVLISHKGLGNLAIALALNKVSYKHVSTAGIPKLMNNVMAEIDFNYPPELAEQQKISNFFKDVDNKITSLQNALSKTKELKRSLVYKLLVVKNGIQPELRFPEFISPWIESKTEDIFDSFKRGVIDTIDDLSKEPTDDLKYPVYSAQVANNGICGYTNTYTHEDCITWVTVGQKSGLVFFREGKFNANDLCGIVTSHRGCSNRAMAEILNRVAYRYKNSSDIPQVNMATFKQIIIKHPEDVLEQEKLSNVFKDVDNLIFAYERVLEQQKTLKQAILQRMFI